MILKSQAWAVTIIFLTLTAVSATDFESPSTFQAVSAVVEMPGLHVGHQMAYDAESNRIVMFGGESGFLQSIEDTYVYDLKNNSWQNMNPTVVPPPRLSPGMAYDSKADRVIMFGGNDEDHNFALQDTWSYDFNNNTWTELNPAVSPMKRIGAHMVYDVKLDKIIMFGGLSEHDVFTFNDTWTYDFGSNTWTEIAAVNPPMDRCLAIMIYDIESDRVVLFGGYRMSSDSPDNETWVYDPNSETWSKMNPAASPSPRFDTAGVYDSKADRFLIFGGAKEEADDTWAYDLNVNVWSKINTSSSPSSRISAMAYDSRSDRSILFGGMYWDFPDSWGDVYNDTWVFDYGNSTWTMFLPDVSKPTLAITSPADGASFSLKEINVTGTALDNVGISKVEVSLDNSTWITAIGTKTWFATLTLAEGENTIYIRVTDLSGNIATGMIHVNISSQNIPAWALAALIAGIAGIVVAAYLVMRQRRKTMMSKRK